MISVTLKSTRFLAEMRKRAAAFKGVKVSAKIVVPNSLRWWYWLEFGTAGRQDANAPVRTTHSGTYPIDPVDALILSWPGDDGHRVFKAHVDHPGIIPRRFVQKVLPSIRDMVRHAVGSTLISNEITPDYVQFAVEKAAESAVAMMTESLAQETKTTPRTDRWGKGATAAELFNDGVKIVTGQ
jgi:hypothetical protein